MAPALDPHNTVTNDAGGDSDDVSNLALVGARAPESKGNGDGIAGEPKLEPHETGPVEGEGGVEGK